MGYIYIYIYVLVNGCICSVYVHHFSSTLVVKGDLGKNFERN